VAHLALIRRLAAVSLALWSALAQAQLQCPGGAVAISTYFIAKATPNEVMGPTRESVCSLWLDKWKTLQPKEQIANGQKKTWTYNVTSAVTPNGLFCNVTGQKIETTTLMSSGQSFTSVGNVNEGQGITTTEVCPSSASCPPKGTKGPRVTEERATGTSWGGGSVCSNNCVYDWTPDTSWRNGAGTGTYFYAGQGHSAGHTCNSQTPAPPPLAPPEGPGYPRPSPCQAGQCPGSVNGTSVCVPCNADPGNEPGSRDETTTTTQSGSGQGTTTTTRETRCSGSTCTTTTTTTTTPPGGGTPTVSQQTTSQSSGSYCAANPRDTACGGDGVRPGSGAGTEEGDEEDPSQWGGSCVASFTCSGDAIQCAMAREQHVRNCQLIDTETPLSAIGRNAANGQQPSDHPANNGETSNFSLASMLDASPLFGGSGGCPADVSLEYQGHSLTLPFSRACSALQMLGNIWVGLAYLAAFVIVFRRG
jgi:hypothetical protein